MPVFDIDTPILFENLAVRYSIFDIDTFFIILTLGHDKIPYDQCNIQVTQLNRIILIKLRKRERTDVAPALFPFLWLIK
jgi:hypothetical protein